MRKLHAWTSRKQRGEQSRRREEPGFLPETTQQKRLTVNRMLSVTRLSAEPSSALCINVLSQISLTCIPGRIKATIAGGHVLGGLEGGLSSSLCQLLSLVSHLTSLDVSSLSTTLGTGRDVLLCYPSGGSMSAGSGRRGGNAEGVEDSKAKP